MRRYSSNAVGSCSAPTFFGSVPEKRSRTASSTFLPERVYGTAATCRMSAGTCASEAPERIASRMATVDILCVNSTPLSESCSGMIRREDVREFQLDKVQIHTSFRPGDIVLARVISLGDARAYLLSTASPELGVVSAVSAEAATMVPVSWEEMECPLTKQRELRKVARPQAPDAA